MKRGIAAVFLIAAVVPASAVIIDQIAIVVNKHIIKDSDIGRDIRVTDFLNDAPLSFSNDARKKAANRLLTQAFIRHEIRIADYPTATPQQAGAELNDLIERRFKTQAAFQSGLHRYGLTKPELQMYFQWQLTVLDFISARFKPAVNVTSNEVDAYYDSHAAALSKQHPDESTSELHNEARKILTGEQVNQQFYSWLDQQKKNANIQYLEESLRE